MNNQSILLLLLAGASAVGITTTVLGEATRPDHHLMRDADQLLDVPAMPGVASSRLLPLPDAALAPLQEAFAAYDRIRTSLAHDQVSGIAEAASALASALTTAKGLVPAGTAVLGSITSALEQSHALTTATSLDDARIHFATLSQSMVAIAEDDQRLQAGHFIFRCPMTTGYKKWVQGTKSLANPYMGMAMSTCGSPSTWTVDDQPAAKPMATASAGKGVAFYTCSMHPAVKQSTPGTCPICGMDLIPVTNDQVASGEITVEDARRQLIGVRTTHIATGPLILSIHAPGVVTYDESTYTDVSLKFGGWVTGLTTSIRGALVEKGKPLFTLYSPELYAAEQEYVQSVHAHQGAAANADSGGLLAATAERLRLWDLSDEQIATIRNTGAQKSHTILSPATGYLIDKDIVQGSAVMPGARLFRIAPIDRVWILAEIFENTVSVVHAGQPVTVSLTYLPGTTIQGTVEYLYPSLNEGTRSVRARIVVDNAQHQLKPDMYASVSIAVDVGKRLLVPKSAVIYTGPRRLVFVDLGEGRLRPHQVTLGLASDDSYEVLSGLTAGDNVVTSGNFLIAAESRIRSAEKYWGDDHDSK